MKFKNEYRIGSVTLENPLILGPMAGVTDGPFRRICREMGVAMVATEMVSANAVKYGNKKTLELLDIRPEEHPVSMQLFGPDPETMEYAVKALADQPYDILDINMGCPMPKIVNNGEGSALMRDPERAEAIVRACVKATDRPVTVKMRAGFNDKEINAVEIAKRCEAAGAAAVAVHGRTREQYYTGKASWDIIRQVKEAVSIPVIGNGDVTSPEKAEALVRETGCDFIMIARGARGNPWLFRDILRVHGAENAASSLTATADSTAGSDVPDWLTYENGIHKPAPQEVYELMLRHAKLQLLEKGDYLGICQMRKHIAWYTTGYPNSAQVRAKINGATNIEELSAILSEWVEKALNSEHL